ncbi:hypothetical protein PMZ80_008546 [Knufia obscura]|uniref:Protein kinase domain-containing protein n=1 Tax=Knufia obscura TaxID=1635080 RepID=A0ABR0RG63_9EURO|nr:hypothetical protein PMZ80_008546 [Knufia obscura]
MSFFRDPNEPSSSEESSSSSSSSSSEDNLQRSINDASQDSARDSASIAELIEPDITTESLSLTNTISNGEDGVVLNKDDTRDMMMASMLEELSRYKAAELMNNANAGNGRTYDKASPEVQEFAKTLFARSSSVLNEGGIMKAESASERRDDLRKQFMAGLQKLSYQKELEESRRGSAERGRAGVVGEASAALVRRTSQQPAPFNGRPDRQLQELTWEMDNMNIVRRPSNELQIAPVPLPLRLPSHYQSTFEERGILGRGGFGRVYHTYNVLDQREYAVKKIPLSPKLSQKYHDGGHKELAHILKEVQALARLDHCNVVRYHATWIEAPMASAEAVAQAQPVPMLSYRGQMLLDNKPAQPNSPPNMGRVYSNSPQGVFTDPFNRMKGSEDGLPGLGRIISATSEEDDADGMDKSSFDPFARSENDPDHSKQLWSGQPSRNASVSAPNDTANLFTDGRSRRASSLMPHFDDPSVYVLHVQMSMYPLTLAEYLLPTSSPRRHSYPTSPRHCFHIVPALRLLLSILCGLQYIHSQGYLHRDIKPSNIFLSTPGLASPLAYTTEQGYADIGSCPSCPLAAPRFMNPRIGDFGLVAELARATGSQHESAGSDGGSKAVGTEYYRPPPHRHSVEFVDERIDVFALGVILLELLWSCGTRMERIALLQGAQKGQMPDDLKEKLRAQNHSEDVVRRAKECIAGMIHPDPKQRSRCGIVKEGVEGILSMISEQSAKEEPD